MTPPPYPPGVEDALRTAWLFTRRGHPVDIPIQTKMAGRIFMDVYPKNGTPFRLRRLEDGEPLWEPAARAAVDSLPEYQAWRASIDKKEGE